MDDATGVTKEEDVVVMADEREVTGDDEDVGVDTDV